MINNILNTILDYLKRYYLKRHYCIVVVMTVAITVINKYIVNTYSLNKYNYNNIHDLYTKDHDLFSPFNFYIKIIDRLIYLYLYLQSN